MSNSATTPDFDALIKHGRWVRALAHSLMADSAAAEDLAQRTWLAALENPPREGVNEKAWLGGVVRILARNHWREQKARRRREGVVADNRQLQEAQGAEFEQPDFLVNRMDSVHKLANALAAMPEPYGRTLYLRFFEELTIREIAERFSIPQSTAHARIHRGLEMMRAELAQSVGKDWRSHCLAFTVPLTTPSVGVAVTALTMTLKTKLLVGAAALMLTSFFVFEPWVGSGRELELPPDDLESASLARAVETLPTLEDVGITRHSSSSIRSISSMSSLGGESEFQVQVRHAADLGVAPRVEVLYFDHATAPSDWETIARQEHLNKEQRLERFGIKLTASEKGELSFPKSRATAEIAARQGDLFGYVKLDRDTESSIEILLDRVYHQEVLVVDESGNPVEGAVVGFALVAQEPKVTALTNARGMANLRHLDFHMTGNSLFGNSTVVGLLTPCDPVQAVVVEDYDLGKEVIEFVMPRTGEVRVICQVEDGTLLKDGSIISLTSSGQAISKSLTDSWGTQQAEVSGGIAIFPKVGLGAKLLASAFHEPENRKIEAAGFSPERSTDITTIELVLPNPKPIPMVRLDLTNSSQASKGSDSVEVQMRFVDQRGVLCSDELTCSWTEGNPVEIPVVKARNQGAETARFIVQSPPRMAQLGYCDFMIHEFDLGEDGDLGRVIEASLGDSFLVSGKVIDWSGAPVSGTRLHLQLSKRESSSGMGNTYIYASLKTGPEGEFKFSGTYDFDAYRLRLTLGGTDMLSEQRPYVPVEIGQKEIVIKKASPSSLEGRLLVDDPAWYREFKIQPQLPGAPYMGLLHISAVYPNYDHGRFSVEKLPLHRMELELSSADFSYPIATLPLSEFIPSPEPGHHTIPDWDLRGKLFRHEVFVNTEPVAKRVSGYMVVNGVRGHFGVNPGEPVVMFLPMSEMELEIRAVDFRAKKFISDGDTEVSVEPGLSRTVVLPEGVHIQDDTRWKINFTRLSDSSELTEEYASASLRQGKETMESIFSSPGLWSGKLYCSKYIEIREVPAWVTFTNGGETFTFTVADVEEPQTIEIPVSMAGLEDALAELATKE